MKKSPSQLVMEALFREDAAERKPSGGAGDGMMAFSRSTGVFSAGDLSGFGFGFGDSNTLNGSITDHPWSQNLNVRHPAISTTIDSQSSFCVASPTSATNPNGKDNLAPGGTSGSDSDSESLLDTEGDPCEQSRDPTDMKRMRRMVSNRESARRSRKRKQAHLADLETQVDQLRGVNASLFEQFTDANQQFKTAVTDNRILKSDVEALRVKVKMAEDMVTRGALSCGLGHLGLAPILNPRQTCQATDTITGLDFTGDDACFAELSPAEHLQNSPIQSIASLESLENPMPGDAASCGVWHWDSHSNGMSK